MNKKGVMFTMAAIFLVLVILAAFLVQTNNKSKTDIQTSNIKTKTTNDFMDSLINNYLPDALNMTMDQSLTPINPSPEDLEFLNEEMIPEIESLASKTGIQFSLVDPIEGITLDPEEPGSEVFYSASFDITFTIINDHIKYESITETILVTGFQAPL